MSRFGPAHALCAAGTLAALLSVWGSLALFVELALLTATFAALYHRVQNERLRLVTSYIYSLWLYQSVARVAPASPLPQLDDALGAMDAAIFGTRTVCELCPSPEIRGWMEAASAAYLSYHLYLHGALAWSLRSTRAARRLGKYLFTGLGLGFAGYLLFPAMGPGAGCPATGSPGGWLTALNARVVQNGSPGWDVFPSLHVLIPLCILRHDWLYLRRRFWIMTPFSGAMMLAALCLGYHYAVDLIAGVAWLVPVLLIVEWRPSRGSAP